MSLDCGDICRKSTQTAMADLNIILEGSLKFREGKKVRGSITLILNDRINLNFRGISRKQNEAA